MMIISWLESTSVATPLTPKSYPSRGCFRSGVSSEPSLTAWLGTGEKKTDPEAASPVVISLPIREVPISLPLTDLPPTEFILTSTCTNEQPSNRRVAAE